LKQTFPIAGRNLLMVAGALAVVIVAVAWGVWRFRGGEGDVEGEGDPPVYGYRVVRSFPHRADAYTQGLAFHDGTLYESTGRYGGSTVRKVDLESGEVIESVPLDGRLFGEGLTIRGDRLYQLTWRRGIGFVYDRETLRVIEQFDYAGEGWGLTHDDSHLIMSNGGPELVFLDPATFRIVRRLRVGRGGHALLGLNELEYVDGEIYANLYPTNWIARISPRTGTVVGLIDLTGLLDRREPGARHAEVLNGIAYDEKGGRLFVTGKDWPRLFQIELVPR
jgi:glutamine cyclotransferase